MGFFNKKLRVPKTADKLRLPAKSQNIRFMINIQSKPVHRQSYAWWRDLCKMRDKK
jgi:hypothetical protein